MDALSETKIELEVHSVFLADSKENVELVFESGLLLVVRADYARQLADEHGVSHYPDDHENAAKDQLDCGLGCAVSVADCGDGCDDEVERVHIQEERGAALEAIPKHPALFRKVVELGDQIPKTAHGVEEEEKAKGDLKPHLQGLGVLEELVE